MLRLFQIHHEFVDPERRSLSDCRRLRRLEMRKTERGLILVFIRKFRECRDDINQFPADQLQSLPHNNNVRIISDVAGCSPQMNDPRCLRTLLSVGVYMAHDIVPHQLLSFLRHLVIDIICVRLQLVNLFLRDRKPQLPLRFRQRDPELPPCFEFLVRRKDILHLSARVPCGKRTYISVISHF